MGVGSTDSGMYALVLGILKRIDSYVDVLLDSPCECTYRRPGDGLGNLHDRVEVTRAGDRETCLDDIHAETFERLGYLDFLNSIELASRHLLAVPECGIENINPVVHTLFLAIFWPE